MLHSARSSVLTGRRELDAGPFGERREGNLPGGTVDLTFRFGLRDDRIATLQIVPTETAES
jgi:hypothetical protein